MTALLTAPCGMLSYKEACFPAAQQALHAMLGTFCSIKCVSTYP